MNGSRLWVELTIGTLQVQFQPGELAKLPLLLFLASVLADRPPVPAIATPSRFGRSDLRRLFPVLLAFSLAFVVLVVQRDLGASVLLFATFVVMLYAASGHRAYLISGGVLLGVGGIAAYSAFDHVRIRVGAWLHPFDDPFGSGYQIVQGLYAMGAGSLTGSGLGLGRPDLIPFAATDFIYAAVAEELGLVGTLSVILWSNLRRPMRMVIEHHLGGDVTRVQLASQVSFLNRAALRKTFDGIEPGKHVLIDAHDTVYIDPDILSLIKEYREVIGPTRGVRVSTRGFRDKYAIEDRIEFVDFTSRELQDQVTPSKALRYLLDGNERFRKGHRLRRDLSRQVAATATSQHPMAVVLSCIDSRTPAELIFDLGLGDIFSVRVAGNIVTSEILGSIEFGCVASGAKLIVVVGHTRCVAVQATVDHVTGRRDGEVHGCSHVRPIIDSLETLVRDAGGVAAFETGQQDQAEQALLDGVVRQNVIRSVDHIMEQSDALCEMLKVGRVGIVGMVYDVATGSCEVIEETVHGLSLVAEESNAS